MSSYLLRKNFKTVFSDNFRSIRAKITLKTEYDHWVDTHEPVVITISTHSVIHNNYEGDLKMNALISIIKNNVRGKVTVLFTEKAHLNVMSLKHKDNATKVCLHKAQELHFRYQSYFEGCNIAYWHSYICEDPHFVSCKRAIADLFQKDPTFQELIKADANGCYTQERKEEFPNKDLFLEKTAEDILEHCLCWVVLKKKGYKFQFYPGYPYVSMDYAAAHIAPELKKLEWIRVFLSIEKKVELLTTSLV